MELQECCKSLHQVATQYDPVFIFPISSPFLSLYISFDLILTIYLLQPAVFDKFNALVVELQECCKSLHQVATQFDPVFMALDLSALALTQPLTQEEEETVCEKAVWTKVICLDFFISLYFSVTVLALWLDLTSQPLLLLSVFESLQKGCLNKGDLSYWKIKFLVEQNVNVPDVSTASRYKHTQVTYLDCSYVSTSLSVSLSLSLRFDLSALALMQPLSQEEEEIVCEKAVRTKVDCLDCSYVSTFLSLSLSLSAWLNPSALDLTQPLMQEEEETVCGKAVWTKVSNKDHFCPQYLSFRQ